MVLITGRQGIVSPASRAFADHTEHGRSSSWLIRVPDRNRDLHLYLYTFRLYPLRAGLNLVLQR